MAKWTRPQTADPPVPHWADDFTRAKQRLKVRLCPPESLEGPGAPEVLRQDPAHGLALALAYDLDGRALDVAPDHILPWATPAAALFALGISNLWREEALQTTRRNLPDGTSLLAVRGRTDFVAAQLLVADRFLQQPTQYGILACVPKDNLLLVLPITDAGSLGAAPELAKLARLLHAGAPDGLSPHLYWFHKNGLKQVPTTDGPDGLTLAPPARFVTRVIEPLTS